MTFPSQATDMAPFSFIPTDLAPGDARALEFDTTRVDVLRVCSANDPLFELAYAKLWAQFGAVNELESREVLARRLSWGAAPFGGYAMQGAYAMHYDLVLVQSGEQFVAVRDHTAIAEATGVVVHLSHLFIDPAWRRGGLAGWLRAFPLQTARACLERAGLPANTPVTLAAEMEYPDGRDEARLIRLQAYERAGYKKIDPAAIDYHQPDFRTSAEIDAGGGPRPLPFQLVVRRVGREAELHLSGSEARAIVGRLYHMYAQEFRTQDMEEVWRQLKAYPAPEARVALLPPTA